MQGVFRMTYFTKLKFRALMWLFNNIDEENTKLDAGVYIRNFYWTNLIFHKTIIK